MNNPRLAILTAGILLSSYFASSALAQGITLADIDGASIETTVVYDQVGRKDGAVMSSRLRDDRKITIGPGDTLQHSIVHTVTGPRGTRVFPTPSGTFTLNKPREVHSLGEGHAIWVFANGTLTFLRTYRSGGYKTEITFHRNSAGLTCSIRSPFARENGTGDIEMTSLAGGTWQLISSRVLSTSCRVAKH
jgi:hypothetical protein